MAGKFMMRSCFILCLILITKYNLGQINLLLLYNDSIRDSYKNTLFFSQSDYIIKSIDSIAFIPKNVKGLIINASIKRSHKKINGSIGDFKELKILDANFVSNKKIPKEILNLKSMQAFTCNCIFLHSLPSSFSKLDSLKFLDLTISNLKKIPILPNNIVYLGLGSNHLKILPNQILKLSQLEYFKLNFNKLEKFPYDLSTLDNLKLLDVTSYKKFTLNFEMYKFKKLEDLSLNIDLDTNNIDILSKMKSLQSLCIYNNYKNGEFEYDKSSLKKLNFLKKLIISSCELWTDDYKQNMKEFLSKILSSTEIIIQP
ncbi:MAG: leucine-rich repeat domain-containing protein [Bacteroidota bacterium]